MEKEKKNLLRTVKPFAKTNLKKKHNSNYKYFTSAIHTTFTRDFFILYSLVFSYTL